MDERSDVSSGGMTRMRMTGYRLPEDQIARIEAYAERLRAETGLSVTTSDAVRLLIEKGLESVSDAKPSPKKRPKR